MEHVTLEIHGLVDEEEIESLLEISNSGFVLEKRGVGRSRRYSHIGDVIQIIGGIGSLAAFAKTVVELVKLRKNAAQNEPNATFMRITAADGRSITISGKDSHSVPDIVRALQGLD